jgi:hypothetical protein
MAAFGLTAVRTFAHGVAGLTGNDVAVEVRGCSAYTDGRTVVLPAEGSWEAGDFRALCGVACHEVAHVWFRSPDQLPPLLGRHPVSAGSRVQRAFNVVADVADETWFARAMPRADALFAAAREHVLNEAFAAGVVTPTPPPTVPEEQLLAVGVLWARSPARSAVRLRLKAWLRKANGLCEVVSLLGKARESRGRATSRYKPARTSRQLRKLTDLTGRLIELLDRLYPRQAGQGPADESTAVQGPPGTGADANGTGGAGGDTVTDAMTGWANAAMVAAAGRALVAAGRGTIPDSFDWEQAADQWCDGDILHRGVGSVSRGGFRQDCYEQVWPAFKRVSQDLATGPTVVREDGFLSGGQLSRPHRAAIDGRCFRRSSWQEGPGASVAVIFDQSGSMANCLDVFLPVGAALADALRAVPNVEVAIWRFGNRVERVNQTAHLRQAATMGGTATHLVIGEAAEWLESRPAQRRVVVLFTDGRPDKVEATHEAVIRLRRRGSSLLVGAIGLSELECSRSMPGGVVFSVDPLDAGSSLHVAANRLRRMSR